MPASVQRLVRRSGFLLLLPVLVAAVVVPPVVVAEVSRTAGSGNLLSNPGCESGTTYFTGYQARLESVSAVRRSGLASCRATSTGGGYFSLLSTQSAANPGAGATYAGSAWVRSDAAVGRRVYLALRERGGAASHRTLYGAAVLLSTEWQQVTSTLTVRDAGRTALDFYLVQDPGVAGNSFYVDDLAFGQGSTTDPTPPPTTTVPTTTVPTTTAPTTTAPTTTAPTTTVPTTTVPTTTAPTTTVPTTTVPTTTAPTTTAPPTTAPPTTTPPGGSAVSTLRAGAGGRYLERANGSRFFWLGDTAWSIFTKLTREQTMQYLDTRRGQGFTVVQASAIFPDAGPIGPNRYGDQPIGSTVASPLTTPGSDPADPAQYDYWDHVDFVVAEAERRGMYVAMLPVWSHNQAGRLVTTSNAEGYGRFLGQRFAGRNVVWAFGGDDNTRHEGIWRAMAKGIAIGRTGSENYGTTLMTYHPIGNQSSSTTFHNDPWLDFNMVQSGHCLNDALPYTLVASDHARTPTKPVVDSEPLYEEHPICWQTGNGYSTAHQVRKFAYWAVFAGAFGHTYGHHSVWQFYSGSGGGASSPRGAWSQALTAPAAEQMRHLRALMESRPFETGVPDQSIVASPGGGMSRIQATRAASGSYLMVYAPDGQRFTANLTALSGTAVQGHWFDPRTGTVTAVSGVNRGSAVAFTPPTSGAGNDWVLVVDDAARGFPRPGQVP